MYTILINDDKTLTTSVRTTLLHNTSTDEIWFLLKPTSSIEDVSDDTGENPQVDIRKVYTAVLHYDANKIMKSADLATDAELYKERIKFILPRSSAFFSERGLVQLWIEVTIDTITTTTDPDTGEVTVETETEVYNTLPTTLFIEGVARGCNHKGDNTIRITRGDSLTVDITLTDNDGFPYEPVEGDVILFTVKKAASSSTILIQKNVDIETLQIDLVEQDTENLAFGEYKYEVEVTTVSGDHYTVIKNAPFIITEELH